MKDFNFDYCELRRGKLILTTVDILDRVVHQGLLSLENYFENKRLLDDKVYSYYKKGIELIQKGKSPKQLSFLMECEKIKWIRDFKNSEEELELITIIENILPCIQECDLSTFSELCSVLVSNDMYDKIMEMLFDIKPYFFNENQRYSDMFFLALKYKENCDEGYLEYIKKSFRFEGFKITKGYNFQGFSFDCFMKSEDEEIFIDTFLSGDNSIEEPYDIVQKIDCFKNYVTFDQNKKVTILMGIIYNEVQEKKIKKVNSEEEFFDLIINSEVNNIFENNKVCLMIINKDGIFFEDAYCVYV